MDGTTIEIYSNKFEKFKQYKGDKNRKKFLILSEKLSFWDYKYFNLHTEKMKKYFDNVSKLHVQNIVYKSKNKNLKDPDLDIKLSVELLEVLLNLILSGEAQKMLKKREGKKQLLFQISAIEPDIFKNFSIDQILIQINLLKSPINASF